MYKPEWLLPPESEISHWFNVKAEYFPSSGEPGFIMIKQIDIAQEFGQIENLVNQLSAPDQSWNIEKIYPWHPAFRNF